MHRPLTGKVVIATHNAGKLRECGNFLAPFGIEAVSAGELGLPVPDETGAHVRRERRHQGHAAAKATGLPALSDDSGICVDALDGAPGLFTADWAGRTGTSRRHGPGRAGIAASAASPRPTTAGPISSPPS